LGDCAAQARVKGEKVDALAMEKMPAMVWRLGALMHGIRKGLVLSCQSLRKTPLKQLAPQ
jgi:hypothetical protein